MRFTVDRYQTVRPTVSALLTPGRPATVTFFVIAVVIREAVNRIGWRRRLAHVGQEVDKTVFASPATAYLDASASVSIVLRRIGVVAAAHHVSPYAINRSFVWAT